MACCDSPQPETLENTQTVCQNCGLVIEEHGLEEYNGRDDWEAVFQGAARDMHLRNQLKGIMHSLSIPADLLEHVYEKARQANFEHPWGHGAKGLACLLACLYFTIRERNIPKSLDDIIQYSGIAEKTFRAVYNKVKWSVDSQDKYNLEVFLPKALKSLDACQEISQNARLLLSIATHVKMDTGRHQAPICAAAAYMAYICKSRKTAKDVLENLAFDMDCKVQAINGRTRELKTAMIDCARGIPFFSDIDRKKFYKLLPALLEHFDLILASLTGTPTSFTKGVKKRIDTEARIAAARKRIALGQENVISSDSSLDFKDQLIESWVKQVTKVNLGMARPRYPQFLPQEAKEL